MKIVIIGAGLLGVTSAYYLVRKGYEVVVVERQSGPAQETSFANAGMITPAMTSPWNSPGILSTLIKNIGRVDSPFLLRLKALPSLSFWGLRFLKNANEKQFLKSKSAGVKLSLYSQQETRKISEELNIDYNQIATGSCKIFYDQKNFEEYGEYAKLLDQHDIKFRTCSTDEMVKIEPSLAPIKNKICGGVYFPDDEAGDAYKFTCALEKEAKKLGVQFHYNIEITRIEKNAKNITRIVSTKESYEADKFVLCAGSFSPVLARDIDIDIPVKPVKGYSISIPMNSFKTPPHMTVVDDHFHAAITPLGDVLRITAAAEFTGFDDTLDKHQIDRLYHLTKEIFPDLDFSIQKENITHWCGFRPMSVDGNPYISVTDIDNFFVNTGHGSFGWTMAAGSGKILSDIINGDLPEIDASLYALER